MTNGVTFNRSTNTWEWKAGHASGKAYPNTRDGEVAAKKAYVTALLEVEPKYKPLLQGKTWAQIFRILGID